MEELEKQLLMRGVTERACFKDADNGEEGAERGEERRKVREGQQGRTLKPSQKKKKEEERRERICVKF